MERALSLSYQRPGDVVTPRTWVAALVMCMGLTGCGVPASDGAEPLPSDLAAIATPTPTPTQTLQTFPLTQVEITWVRNDKLVPTTRSVQGEGREELLNSALATLVVGPDIQERARGLGTLLPLESRLTGAVGGVSASVSLNLGAQAPTDPTLLGGQVALTALAIPHVHRVRFLVEGSVVRIPVPGGKELRWVTVRDYRRVIKA